MSINSVVDARLYDHNGNYRSVWNRKRYGFTPLGFTLHLDASVALALKEAEYAKAYRETVRAFG